MSLANCWSKHSDLYYKSLSICLSLVVNYLISNCATSHIQLVFVCLIYNWVILVIIYVQNNSILVLIDGLSQFTVFIIILGIVILACFVGISDPQIKMFNEDESFFELFVKPRTQIASTIRCFLTPQTKYPLK